MYLKNVYQMECIENPIEILRTMRKFNFNHIIY